MASHARARKDLLNLPKPKPARVTSPRRRPPPAWANLAPDVQRALNTVMRAIARKG